MNIIVVGCGRVGAELAHRLFLGGNSVVVVDQDERAFHNLPADFRGRTVVGEVLNRNVLHRAEFDRADALAAVTSSDAVNAVICHLAIQEYKIPVVVARNYDSRWRAMHEVFGHQVISSSSWGAQRIEELLYQQTTRTVFSAGNGEVEIYEFAVQEEWDNHTLAELLPGRDCVLVALTRSGQAMLPDTSFSLKTGDLVLVSATLDGSQALRERVNGKEKAKPATAKLQES
jgi:trk system potassium uptake protein TrkA